MDSHDRTTDLDFEILDLLREGPKERLPASQGARPKG